MKPRGRRRFRTGSEANKAQQSLEAGSQPPHGVTEFSMRTTLLFVLCLAAVIAPWSRAAHAEISAEQVRESIDRGVAYLKREQKNDGAWPDPVGYPGGVTALCTLALLNCGVPPNDAQVQSAVNYLRKLEPSMTYSTALQTMVLCAAEPKPNLLLIRRNALWIQQQQK